MASFELKCPVCKSDSFLNPNIKIFISPCFHKLCEQCLYKIFAHGYAPCPECKTQLRRINFITSTFEDVEVERELKIRKQLNKIYEKQIKAINDSDREIGDDEIVQHNDWLEAFEDLVFQLMELKNNSLINARINEIKSDNSILNSKFNIRKPSVSVKDPLEESGADFGIYDDSRDYEVPKEYIVPEIIFKFHEGCGVDNEYILSQIMRQTDKYFGK